MKTKKSIAVWISVLCLVLGVSVLAGCAKKEQKGETAFLVGFANNNDIYDYCAKFRSYLKEETEALGMTLIVTNAGGDTNAQNGQIDDFITQDAKIVSAISNDLSGSIPALEAARKANIPYISFLTTISGADSYDKFIYVGSQNYDAGLLQGQFAAEKLAPNAAVIYFTGEQNDQQYIDRKKGFLDGLGARPDIKILAEFNVKNQKDLGMSTTEDCLQSFPAFDAIICQNDDSALGVVEALKAVKKLDSVMVVGLDGSDGALASVKAGEMRMSVLQDARAQAKAGAEVFRKIKDGTPAGEIADIFVPFTAITFDNVDQYIGK
jgi:ABC-type sugar transport system substrate-binding protein